MHGRIYVLVNTEDEYYAVVSFSTADTSAYEWIDYVGGDPEAYPADIALHIKDDTVIGLVVVTTCEGPGEQEDNFYVCCYAGGSSLSVRWTRNFDWTAPNKVDTQLGGFSQLLFVLGRAQVAQS